VGHLFHEMPGRRKFLRSPDVEMGHVEEAVVRFGVAHPSVRFELAADGVPRLVLPPAGGLRERLGAFFERELIDALVEAESEDPAASFRILAAPPRFARLSLKGQFVYLNGRFIRDRVLTRAINEAFREMVPHGRYPVAFLFLHVAPGEVDVNVHPTKIEVRFRNVWRLHDRIVQALREKLLSSDLAPHLRPGLFAGRAEGGPSPEAIVEYFARGSSAGIAAPAGPPVPLVAAGRRCFQLHDRYIVEEADDGIRVIDQHALHERVLLEEIRRQYKSADVPRQLLLLPAMVEVSMTERTRLEEHGAVLESMGLLLDDFGPSSIAVRAVPALLKDADPAGLVRDLLDRIEEHGDAERAAGHAVPMIDSLLEFLACRAAVKFGDRLAPEELSRLLSDAEGMDYSATCAHGRPTAVKLTLDDLEKYFKRRGI
jgi:DNA mismatch repair protein MutL